MMFLMEWPGGSWQASLLVAGVVIGTYMSLVWLALVFWTIRDARQRTHSVALQLLAGLSVLLFFIPGYALYLILRPALTLSERYERTLEAEAVLQELADRVGCPTCSRRVRDDFMVCPSCKTRLRTPCTNCRRPLSFAWVACAFCGADAPRMPRLAQPAVPRRVEWPAPAVQRKPQFPRPRPTPLAGERTTAAAAQLTSGTPGG